MDRRLFLKFGSLAAGTYALAACAETPVNDRRQFGPASGANVEGETPDDSSKNPGATALAGEVVYTRAAPGPWAGKEAAHLPKLTVVDKRLLLKTEHAMTPEHFISRHQLRDAKGIILYDRILAPDAVPESKFTLPLPAGQTVSAMSLCNLHGMWKEDFPIADLKAGFLVNPVYTQENPGPWTGKEAGHLPALKTARTLVNGRISLEVVTSHPMTPEHYIYSHQVRNFQGETLAKSYLSPETDKTAVSIMEIPAPQSGIELLSCCNLHGIWMTSVAFDALSPVYTAAAPGPVGAPAAHIPTIALTDTSAVGAPSHTVTVTNAHEMIDGTHFVFKHQARTAGGDLIAERLLNPATATTAVSTFEGRLFQGGVGKFMMYAYCNLHGIWKDEFNFEQINILYTDTPGLAGGAAATHRPIVTVEGDKITVKTEHAMTVEHYISKHQIRALDGSLIGEKNFAPTAAAPLSVYPKGALAGNFMAYSYCNLHGIWKSPFTV